MKFGGLILALTLISCNPNPSPSPSPSPSPTNVPTPTPSPSPTECGIVANELWTETLLLDNQLKDVVRLTQADLGSVCGLEPLDSLKLICNRLNLLGYPTVITGDAIYIQRESDGLHEQHHVVYYKDGCWLSNTWKGVWAKENE